MLACGQAGRSGEDGSGALWIAPELLKVATARPCTESGAVTADDPVFGWIESPELANHAAALTRGASVRFDWNDETGELSFASEGSRGVFDDVVVPGALAPARSCGSR